MFYRTLRKVTIIIIAFSSLPFYSHAGDIVVDDIVKELSLREKIGQMSQADLSSVNSVDEIPDTLKKAIQNGEVGSFLNANSPEIVNEVQRIAMEEGNGIPLLIARDVIHGYRTIFPIPLGQAASWDADIIRQGARIAAIEASSMGIRWTFAPMIDISRDPRWGRIAESFGEDPYLTSIFAAASVEGYQGEDLSDETSIAACAKHFLGYGAAEGGRDYNTTYIPEPLLHNVYLPPFDAAVKANVATVMSAFNDLNGVPASSSDYLLDHVLREELGFEGLVVSDWDSVIESIVHGYSKDEREAALNSIRAGVDMEMVSRSYLNNVASLIDSGQIKEKRINEMAARSIALKKELGLFSNPYTNIERKKVVLDKLHLKVAEQSAAKSLVLLKNESQVLPVNKGEKIALIGPLVDAAHDQMGTWVFDGNKEDTVTVLHSMSKRKNDKEMIYAKGLVHSRSEDTALFKEAIKAAKKADKIVFVGGEEASLSGEAHSRADIRLPGAQEELLRELAKLDKPLILVIMAGRQIALNDIIDDLHGIVMAWHPGTMGGEAIADVLLGDISPSGRLPVTWPKVTGQVPMYYNKKNTGRPAHSRPFTLMKDFPLEAPQHSLGHATNYIDVGFEPQFPFGFGLTYSEFEYSNLKVNANKGSVSVAVDIKNTGSREATETAQLYVQDMTGSVTRPIRELKDYRQVTLKPGKVEQVTFQLEKEQLMFFDKNVEKVFEPGDFKLWVAPHALAGLSAEFTL